MTKAEYAEYEAAVADFMERNKLENLSTGRFQCKDCEVKFDDDGKCPDCGADREMQEEAWFSWTPCDCCQRHLGGDREYASGYSRKENEIYEFNICVDCVYYAVYGRLDDTTMMEIERKG